MRANGREMDPLMFWLKIRKRVWLNYWPVTELANVFIVASAAAVDADIVVVLTDDVVLDADETNRFKATIKQNRNMEN